MASPDVVAPALLLSIPLFSLLLALFHTATPAKAAALVLLAVLAAVTAGTALSVACGHPLRVVSKVFATLLHAARKSLSAITIYALGPSLHTFVLLPPFLGFFLSLVALLVACELVSALIPTSPPLLPDALSLASRLLLLTLAIATAILLRRRYAASTDTGGEKSGPFDEYSGNTPGRVSSPTHATWPFPGSLALQDKSQHRSFPANHSAQPDPAPPSTSIVTQGVNEDAYKIVNRDIVLLPLVVTIAQVFATICASLDVTSGILVVSAVNQPNHALPYVRLASAACTLLWSFTVLAVIQILPVKPRPYSSEKQVAIGYARGPLRARFSRDHPAPRTPKPSLPRRESDSLLDFLSLRDPFASSPPPPPPFPLVGLGLDEVDMGWDGNKEIGVQYRFPAPRSIVKKGRRKAKTARASGKTRLGHQDSARTLLPVPETRGNEADADRDKGFGDEARLAQLLLQSLSEGEGSGSPTASVAPVSAVTPPQPAHVQLTSRWSTGTTIQSIMSASVSNKSGVSTYTTCASDKVPTSRISLNTIASVLGSRKSSEAKRKSGTTASSSKG